MNFQDTMLFLQRHSTEGIIVISVVVIALYLIFSIRLLYSCRRERLKVWAVAFVPIINIFIWIRKCVIVRKNNKEELTKVYSLD